MEIDNNKLEFFKLKIKENFFLGVLVIFRDVLFFGLWFKECCLKFILCVKVFFGFM